MDSHFDLYRQCHLCPNHCGVNRSAGVAGRCAVTSELRVARASLHEWEEPPLCGEKGSGTIFFTGCPMSCVFCQNRVLSQGKAGEILTAAQLARVMLKLQEIGAANINFVTATPFIPHVLSAIKTARKSGLTLPLVWNSSAYENVVALRRLEGLIDIYLPDLKYWDDRLAARYSGVTSYRETARAAIAEMYRQVGPVKFADREGSVLQSGMIVRQLLLPGQLEDALAVSSYLYRSYGSSICLSLMSQYTPMPGLDDYPELTRRVSPDEYERWLDACLEMGIENAFIQEGDAASESFIPDFFSWNYRDFIAGAESGRERQP